MGWLFVTKHQEVTINFSPIVHVEIKLTIIYFDHLALILAQVILGGPAETQEGTSKITCIPNFSGHVQTICTVPTR